MNEQIVFIGEIPRDNDFEAKTTTFVREDGLEYFVPDDSAIAIKTSGGIIVITGCGHAGICNTIQYAQEVTGDERIVAVMGGFHLKNDDEITRKVVECFLTQKVTRAFPSHCTELPALIRFYEKYKNPFVASGDIFVFDD